MMIWMTLLLFRMKSLSTFRTFAYLHENPCLHATSSNVYDSLGEAYLQENNTIKAKRYYQKALELDPDNERIKWVLDKL